VGLEARRTRAIRRRGYDGIGNWGVNGTKGLDLGGKIRRWEITRETIGLAGGGICVGGRGKQRPYEDVAAQEVELASEEEGGIGLAAFSARCTSLQFAIDSVGYGYLGMRQQLGQMVGVLEKME